MSDFSYYKKYVFSPDDNKRLDSKHVFFNLLESAVENAEKRISREFPQEIREFFNQIGYGFLCKQNRSLIDRIMGPESIADFILGEDRYEYSVFRDTINVERELAFFEISEDSYLTLDLVHQDKLGRCPVLYLNVKVADSLLEFLNKMDIEDDYYIHRYSSQTL